MKKNNKQKGCVLWFTGLSQSGKSTTADAVYKILKEKRKLNVERLDGDVVRQSLTKDLGFSEKDRNKNIEKVTFIAKLLSRNNVIVLASFISPYRKAREKIRKEVNNYIEVFCNCPLKICEKRDTKGFYKRARKGDIENFTGISDPYERPKNPEIELKTGKLPIEKCADTIINYLEKNKLI